jgi:hypothetical protein
MDKRGIVNGASGQFKPPILRIRSFPTGQLAYFQLRDLVQAAEDPVTARGRLLVRDGLPIINQHEDGEVVGSLLHFKADFVSEAYERIARLEPEKQYFWRETTINALRANILHGRSPNKGSVPFEGKMWNGWDDSLFTAALEVVQETIEANGEFKWDLKPLFRLQMAYLLLWSAIERYLSLRYHLGTRATDKVNNLATEQAFAVALRERVSTTREVARADRPQDKEVLDPRAPEASVRYYYQIRSNLVHRGKGIPRDYEMLLNSASELLQIFRYVLVQATQEAKS